MMSRFEYREIIVKKWLLAGSVTVLSAMTQTHAETCTFSGFKNHQSCAVEEKYINGAKQVNIETDQTQVTVKFESCENELSEKLCDTAQVSINHGKILKAKSYLRDAVSGKIIADEQCDPTAFECVRTLNRSSEVCWNLL